MRFKSIAVSLAAASSVLVSCHKPDSKDEVKVPELKLPLKGELKLPLKGELQLPAKLLVPGRLRTLFVGAWKGDDKVGTLDISKDETGNYVVVWEITEELKLRDGDFEPPEPPVDEDPIVEPPVDEDPIVEPPVDEDPIVEPPVNAERKSKRASTAHVTTKATDGIVLGTVRYTFVATPVEGDATALQLISTDKEGKFTAPLYLEFVAVSSDVKSADVVVDLNTVLLKYHDADANFAFAVNFAKVKE